MFRSIRNKLVVNLLLIVASISACSIDVYRVLSGSEAELSVLFWGGLVVAVFALLQVLKSYKMHLEKIRLLFEAVENNDFTFRFSETKGSEPERITNVTLNRVKEMLSQAKQEAYLQEQYFELILSKSATGVVVCDDRGYVYQSNEAARKLLGQVNFTHLSQLDRIDQNLSAELMNCSDLETKQVVISGEQRLTTLSVKTSYFKKRDALLRILTLNDISSALDEKELESWIRLTRVLTHEIMNSIAPIRSLSELLIRSDDSQSNELKTGLELIHSTSGNLMTFVNHYRQFAKVPPPCKEAIEVEDLLVQCRRFMLSEVCASTKVYIDLEQCDEMPLLMADRGQIVQVIVNLMRNAAEAIGVEKSGRIRLSASLDRHGHWMIGVENNGAPIAKETAEQIFVPFFTTKEGGSGIGLSISKQILRNHQGNLQLMHSTPESTLFTLTF
ncbi:MAG: sensor histidine kinase [Tannerellaceae bacterium]